MNKFTIFTIILAISVITVTSDLVVRDYLRGEGLNSVLTLNKEVSPVIASDDEVVTDAESQESPPAKEIAREEPTEVSTSTPAIPSQPVEIRTPPQPTITQQVIAAGGFTGTLTEKHFDGRLYQLLDLSKFAVESVALYELQENGLPAASITEIALKDEIRALQLYSLLQNKTKTYIDLSLNETNAYGDRSFYINHAKKKDEAFLTVKIGSRIYGFAYVKFFHPEIKKLISILIG